MPKERISILNLLRAGEIFLNEHDNYSDSEQTLLKTMLSRLSAKVDKGKDTEVKHDRAEVEVQPPCKPL